MESVLKSDIFFFVTTTVVVLLGIFAVIAIIYVIKVVKTVKKISETVKKTMDMLSADREYAPFAKSVLKQGWVRPNRRIFDNSKISDHFAIIPTLQAPKHLNDA